MPRARARAFVRCVAAVAATAAFFPLAGPAPARADTPTTTRAEFPDRRFDGVTATDAALAGAGLATDAGSSFYANPALALVGPRTVRGSGALLLPQRDDLRASTTDFQDASGFAALGEAGARLRFRGLGVSAYFAQPHYQHEETRFVALDPQSSGPVQRQNAYTSASRYGGLALAGRLGNGLVLGLAGEVVSLVEHYRSTPVNAPIGLFDTLVVERSKVVLGGAVGASYTARGLVTLGAAYHRAAAVHYTGGGEDDAPALLLAGVRVGRTAGSAGYAGVRAIGRRTVNLGEPGGPTYDAPARTEYALGYAYDAPEGGWFVRLGGGASPRPGETGLRLTRFGVALGVAQAGARVSLGYAHTGETRAGGRPSALNRVLLTVEATR